MQERPHIETVETWCRPLFDDAVTWRTIREAITTIENRVEVPLKLERKDGSVLTFSLTVIAARTTVSPYWTSADPAACLAMRPVSTMSFRPAKSLSTRCIMYSLWNTKARGNPEWAPARLRVVDD